MNKAPTTTTAAGASTKPQSKFSSNSTSIEAQYERILEALRQGPATTEDLRAIGAYHVGGRIKELKDKRGFDIRKVLVTKYDCHGYGHVRMARYSLMSEPDEGFTPPVEDAPVRALKDAAKAIRAHAKGLLAGTVKHEQKELVRARLLEALHQIDEVSHV
jgi:hypothetical protein